MLCGSVVLIGMSVWRGKVAVWPLAPPAAGAWLYLVVFGSLAALSAYMWLSNASAALGDTFVNPAIAMLLDVAFAGETVTGFERSASCWRA